MNANLQNAIRTAIQTYADSLGASFKEACELYNTSESTQSCINLLLLAQADPAGLRKMMAA